MKLQPPVIADTSALISLASVTDNNHSKAVLYSQMLVKTNRSLIIPSDVIAETVNTVGRKIGHKWAIEVGQELLGSKAYTIMDSNDYTRSLAFEKFKMQKSSEQRLKPAKVSYTDCIVMAVADLCETKDVFGFDRGFAENGYAIVR